MNSWEERLRFGAGHPKMPKAIAEDLVHCLNELEHLRIQVRKMRKALEEVQFHHGVTFSNTTKEQVEAALNEP